MKTRWLERTIAYDGSQLRAHWILRTTGIVGDALVAFRGPCRVADAEMADLEDLGGPGIAGADMLHFLSETFDDGDLERAVLRQRLLAAIAAETLRESSPRAAAVRRSGDDLYLGRGKLSVSIATRSPVSTLTHFALNVSAAGTPVETAALEDLGVEPERTARELLRRVEREQASMREARCRVRAKGEHPG